MSKQIKSASNLLKLCLICRYMKALKKGSIKVRTNDFPSFLYPQDGYDPDDLESGLLQNPIVVRFFRHIFTSPGSALLENGGKTKAKGCQAKINGMKEVTPGSIAYAHTLFRHFITGIKDWRIEDDLFDRDQFHQMICSFFELDAQGENDWAKDTLDWWNMKIFGTKPTNVNEEDIIMPEPSSISTLKEQRARKTQKTVAVTQLSLPPSSPPRDPSMSPPPESQRSPSPPFSIRQPLCDIRLPVAQNTQDIQQPTDNAHQKPWPRHSYRFHETGPRSTTRQPAHHSSPPRASTSSRYSQERQRRPDSSLKWPQSSPARSQKKLPARR
jgi:hypothetical protein